MRVLHQDIHPEQHFEEFVSSKNKFFNWIIYEKSFFGSLTIRHN